VAESRLQRSHRSRLDRIRARALARVLALDTSDTSRFVEQVVPVVLAAQTAAVAETDAFLSMEAGLATRTSTEPWGLAAAALIGVHARRGDFLEDVYARNHRAAESSFAERMAREVTTDITLAERAATFVHTEGDTRITGYRRVASGTACTLCSVAATQRYSRGDLRPIHHGCSCTTAPVYGDAAGWRKPNKASLNALYERAGGSDAGALRRITADGQTVEIVNDVLGPTLVPA
jgi:hypothetical protein